MNITAEQVRQLRELSGSGVMECRKALMEAGGDQDKAAAILREKGAAIQASKESRKAEEGCIMAYVHNGGKLAALIEVNCESDFVARNEEFVAMAKELAMQVAAMTPKWISREEVPEAFLAEQKAEFLKQAEVAGKMAQAEEFVKEKVEHLYSQVCLLEQPYIRDSALTVGTLITDKVSKFKEKMKIRRFTIYRLGGGEEA
jgi:elongation factor Ts